MITPKYIIKKKRKDRVRKTIRKKLSGTPERPRMIFVRSNKYLYTQVYDDSNGTVLASATTLAKDVKEQLKSAKDKEAAKVLGKLIADKLKEKKITSVVFDRNIYAYTGRVKVFADSARESGLKF
jgi:large subunit ribosomal protein L18